MGYSTVYHSKVLPNYKIPCHIQVANTINSVYDGKVGSIQPVSSIVIGCVSSVAWYKYVNVHHRHNNIPQHILAFHTAINHSSTYNLKVETKFLIMNYLVGWRALTSRP